MPRKRLTKSQRKKNQRDYYRIREGWKKTGGKKKNGDPISYKQFKNRVKMRTIAEGLSVKEAVEKELRSETFTTPAERSRENLIFGLKNDFKNTYSFLKKISRGERGRFIGLRENLKWNRDYSSYIVGGRYLIDFRNSPKMVRIVDLENDTVIWKEEK